MYLINKMSWHIRHDILLFYPMRNLARLRLLEDFNYLHSRLNNEYPATGEGYVFTGI